MKVAVVYAVALHDSGRGAEALRTLEAFLARRPGDPQARALLQSYER